MDHQSKKEQRAIRSQSCEAHVPSNVARHFLRSLRVEVHIIGNRKSPINIGCRAPGGPPSRTNRHSSCWVANRIGSECTSSRLSTTRYEALQCRHSIRPENDSNDTIFVLSLFLQTADSVAVGSCMSLLEQHSLARRNHNWRYPFRPTASRTATCSPRRNNTQ